MVNTSAGSRVHASSLLACACAAVAGLTACGGGDAADTSGEYTLSVTNRENGCGFENWEEDASASGIVMTISQDEDDQLTATIDGAVGVLLDVLLGSSALQGEVDGALVQLTLHGTDRMAGECTYFVDALAIGRLDGDALEGTIEYVVDSDGSSDCPFEDGCTSVQDFNGTRPP